MNGRRQRSARLRYVGFFNRGKDRITETCYRMTVSSKGVTMNHLWTQFNSFTLGDKESVADVACSPYHSRQRAKPLPRRLVSARHSCPGYPARHLCQLKVRPHNAACTDPGAQPQLLKIPDQPSSVQLSSRRLRDAPTLYSFLT
jgi:hypothetical protein